MESNEIKPDTIYIAMRIIQKKALNLIGLENDQLKSSAQMKVLEL